LQRVFVVIVVLLAVACPACTSASLSKAGEVPSAAPTGYISHQGRWLTDAQGRILLPHGINYVVKQPPFDPLNGFNAADATLLAASGFHSVRLGVLFDALMPKPGRIDTTYLQQIVQMVNSLAKDHIFVLLDMHQDEYGPVTGVDGFPAWATITDGAANPKLAFPNGYYKSPAVQAAWASFWADRKGPGGIGLQERYVEALVVLAKTFKANKSVLGYDIMNEPWPGADYASCETDAGCPSLEKQLLAPFYTKAARAIRSVDPHHLLFVEPFLTFDYEGTTAIPSFGSPANALSFHPYIAQFPGQTGKAITLSIANRDALLVTEFGATSDVPTINQFLDGFDSQLMPWLFWDYSVIAHQQPSSSETNEQALAALKALARPYPLAVAGIPSSYSFDPSSARFRLSYSSRRLNGKPFPSGTVTDVITPRITYPSGYSVSSVGATVTSNRCAPILTLRATAPSVTVLVRPGGGCG
jgi:endoglycosylceramidase